MRIAIIELKMNWALDSSYQQLIWKENTRNMQMKTLNRRNILFASPSNGMIGSLERIVHINYVWPLVLMFDILGWVDIRLR